MIIVITPEKMVQNETDRINGMFQEGLDLLHIRKPCMTATEMTEYISRIHQEFHQQLVLHSHYETVQDFMISRLHFRADRQNERHTSFKGNIISTSVHDMETFNELGSEWEYAFVSPVFPSISKKGYGENSAVLHEIKKRNNPDVKLIALGGIRQSNIQELSGSRADGVALLGAVWECNESIQMFRKCRQNALSL